MRNWLIVFFCLSYDPQYSKEYYTIESFHDKIFETIYSSNIAISIGANVLGSIIRVHDT